MIKDVFAPYSRDAEEASGAGVTCPVMVHQSSCLAMHTLVLVAIHSLQRISEVIYEVKLKISILSV